MAMVVEFLIGLPGSGKTTYRKSLGGDPWVCSSDDYIELGAELRGETYNEAFDALIKPANAHFRKMVVQGIEGNAPHVIIDRTNLTRSSRQKIIKMFPPTTSFVATVFLPDNITYMQRLHERMGTGKDIAIGVIMSMAQKYEEPTEEEGFDAIQII